MRGTRYFIEFPIVSKNFNAFSMVSDTQQHLETGAEKHGVKIVNTDSYNADEN